MSLSSLLKRVVRYVKLIAWVSGTAVVAQTFKRLLLEWEQCSGDFWN